MKNIKKSVLLGLSMIMLFGCSPTIVSSSEENSITSENSSIESSESIVESSSNIESTVSKVEQSCNEIEKDLENYTDEEMYNAFFDYNNKIELHLYFTNEAIYNLQTYAFDEYKKEMYHPCTAKLVINGKTVDYDNVGARMHGNTSRKDNFVTEDGKLKDSVHYNVTFNKLFNDDEVCDYYKRTYTSEETTKFKNRRFGGMKKFQVKFNQSTDLNYSRQDYAFAAFREEGIPAQKTNLIRLTVHTETDSRTEVYDALEPIDKEFLSHWFTKAEKKGNLYKTCWQNSKVDFINTGLDWKIGIEGPNYSPTYNLKTNDDTPDHTLLTNFLNLINDDTSSAEEFKPKLEEVANTEELLKYMAMSWVMGNPDDMRNFNNNVYMYFNSSNNKLELFPYDYDKCLGIINGWAHMESVPHYTTKHNIIYGNGSKERWWQENPIYWRMILTESDDDVDYSEKWPMIQEYRDMYDKLCVEYAKKYLDAAKYEAFNNQFYYSIKDVNNVGKENISFEEYATAKLNVLSQSLSLD